MREAARERLIPFCKYMWPGFQSRPYRELIAASLELLEARIITRLMILAPPQWGKSEILTRNFPAWYLGRHPDDGVILSSYSSTLAESLSFEARDKFLSPRFRAVFGDLSSYEIPVAISDRSASTKEWRIKNHRGKMKSAGIGAGIGGHAANLLLIDDPVKDADEGDSEIIQQRNIAWYTGAAYSRLAPDGIIALAMTRWNENDLAGWLLKEQRNGGDKWYVLRLTAMAESAQEIAEWCKRNNVSRERYLVADMEEISEKYRERRLRSRKEVALV